MGLFTRRTHPSAPINNGVNGANTTNDSRYNTHDGINNSNYNTRTGIGHQNDNVNHHGTSGYFDNANYNTQGGTGNMNQNATNNLAGTHHPTHNGIGNTTSTHHNHNSLSNRTQNTHNGLGNTATTDHHHNGLSEKRANKKANKQARKRALFDIDSGHYNRRPSFGQWLKFTWLDIITMILMGAVGLGVYEAHPAPSRSFPVTFLDGEIVFPQFAYPLRHEIVPIWLAALLAALIPIFIILCIQIRIRSFWDVNNAIIGLLYSLITAAVFQVFVKWLIGGLRPHFLSVCDPDPALVIAGGTGFRNVMFQRNICRGDINQIDDSLESMPSGHSTAAWAGFLYLYFYLNAKLKVFSNYHPPMWKIIALYSPLLGATLITGALTIDEYHNWYDCLAGAFIGSVTAISAYRMVYASVWDFRFNHIPLTRHTPFSYGAGQAGAGGFETAVFTRAAGWGYEEAYGGAPFDAAHNLRGQALGFNNAAAGRHERGGGLFSSHQNHHNTNKHNGVTDVERDAAIAGNTPGYNNSGHLGHHDHNGGYHSNNNYTNGTVGSGPRTTNGQVTQGMHDTYGTSDTYAGGQPVTPTRDGSRYANHRKSIERKAVPAVPSAAL